MTMERVITFDSVVLFTLWLLEILMCRRRRTVTLHYSFLLHFYRWQFIGSEGSRGSLLYIEGYFCGLVFAWTGLCI